MNVAHLCCGVEGGADIAAVRIHKTLLSAGVNSRYYHLGHASPDKSFTKFNESASIFSIISKRIDIYKNKFLYGNIKPDTESFSDPLGNPTITFDQLNFPDVDVITLHWIATFFNLEPFFASVPSNVKFVWCLHDLNPITGGCHYTGGCNKFEAGCNKCPQLINSGLIDRALKNFTIKSKLYEKYLKGRIHVVADSSWVGDMVHRSKLLSTEPMSVVNYPIETNSFRYIGRNEARRVLGLDADKFIMLFGSGSLDNKRKGLDVLIEAIKSISNTDILLKLQLVTFGSGNMSNHLSGIDIRNFNRVTAHEFLALLYNAADYFIMPSLEEALGQTAMESLCCGTPVIAFPTGGLLDTVDPSNGILADSISREALSIAILQAFSKRFDNAGISNEARARYSFEVKAKEYLKVYDEVVLH
jgi:glycosyltransferase involved in cell wall biosynthesis